MSVASRNPFSLLGDDGEDAAPVAAPKAAAGAAPAKAAQPARNVPGAGQKKNNAPRSSQAPRNRGGVDPSADETKDSRGGRPRGEGRGRGGRGGARGGREPRGRVFDRHSQTDRVDSQKAVSMGWGGDDAKRELDAENKAEADAKAENSEALANGGDATPVEAAAPVEEEDKTLTLDQYLAAQAEKRAALAAPKVREAPKDDSAWSNFGVKVEKSGGDDYFAATKQEKSRARTQKEGKQILEIEQRFSEPAVSRGPPRGGARGGRGGNRGGDRPSRGAPRGGAARGGARSGNNASASVNLADQSAFPKLS